MDFIIMYSVCQCEECKSGKYNPLDYIIKDEDIKKLDEERPLGISGHLRVKNESMSIAQSIDSCIDALDELIITYNTSEDNTEEILKEYQKKYPDKIRLYHYQPNIINYISTKEELEEFKSKNMSYETNSIHSLANYYNFGYTKIKYQYYMKIDADQIYFTEKLLETRKALLYNLYNIKEIPNIKEILKYINYISFMEKIAWIIPLKSLREKFRFWYKAKLYRNIITNLGTFELVILHKLKNNNKCSFVLGGIESILYDDKISVVFRDLNINKKRMDIKIFMGCVGDHTIWMPTSKEKYYTVNGSPSEGISTNGFISEIGLYWVHVGLIKRKKYIDDRNLVVPLENINKINYNDIKKFHFDAINENTSRTISYWAKTFLDYDKKYITKYFIDKYFNDILEYALKNYK
ncbi:glycosyltransferase [Brachyspira hyodysenteriae]|nr:glycosyltransferase [Brachyspira hyodysenteriae]MCZ9888492.1 glycosyltransferase [Brachyspira hyodysenteriae]MCZ9891318.1 glycosyltransferase [Brachyspira hyodysenteriae]MCZ9965795.1 glycosyltransferase [Brachyspira hyodysenteriae]MCZ9980522.1 glycosyltransferase [Brachyspira hyodysenteriae]MCZ9988404.1 glycosyltransferase [Brachyspira hyodysenteriae]